MMKKLLILSVFAVLALAQIASAHDPRTVAKEFSHILNVEGAGKLTLTYKSLHWNEPTYLNAKKNEQLRTRLNASLWRKIGTFNADFDVMLGDTKVPKGTYDLGINFGANDDFALVLRSGSNEMKIPFKTSMAPSEVSFLTFDIRPTSDTDSFVIEGRSGKFITSIDMKVPYLAPHDHANSAGEHKHDAATADKKPEEKKPM